MRRRLLNVIGSIASATPCSSCDWLAAVGIFTRERCVSRLAASSFDAATLAASKQTISCVDADKVAAVVALAALLKHFIVWKLSSLA
jgi:hypothetical protein